MNLTVKILFILFSSIVLSSCESQPEKPSYILSEGEFETVLVDFQKAEAIIRLGYNRNSETLIPNDSLYNSTFRKHNITRAIFDSNYNYYSNYPEVFEEIYEKVIERLNNSSAELSAGEKLPTEQKP